jgi:hypothetical protein
VLIKGSSRGTRKGLCREQLRLIFERSIFISWRFGGLQVRFYDMSVRSRRIDTTQL